MFQRIAVLLSFDPSSSGENKREASGQRLPGSLGIMIPDSSTPRSFDRDTLGSRRSELFALLNTFLVMIVPQTFLRSWSCHPVWPWFFLPGAGIVGESREHQGDLLDIRAQFDGAKTVTKV